MAILVFIDDIILAGNDIDFIHEFKQVLDLKFKLKDLGILKFFLGLEIARSLKGLLVCQRKYTLEVLADAGFLGARPAECPMSQNLKLNRFEGEPIGDTTMYGRLVGRLH